MIAGLSLFDVIYTFTGDAGAQMTPRDLALLVRGIFAIITQPDSGDFLMRTATPPTDGRGVFFASTPTDLPPGWSQVMIEADDVLHDEQFIVSYDSRLPFVMSARREGDHVQVVVSIDLPILEGARAILSQYYPPAGVPVTVSRNGYFASGRALGQLRPLLRPHIVTSWVNSLLIADGGDQMNVLQNLLGALWVRLGYESVGVLPPMDGDIFQQVTITTPDGQDFEAVGLADDETFVERCYVCAGLLTSQPEAYAEPERATPVQSVLSWTPDMQAASTDVERILDMWLESIDQTVQVDQTTTPANGVIQVSELIPKMDVEILTHISAEIAHLRDQVLDRGDKPHEVLERFVEKSMDLVMLVDELIYMQKLAVTMQHTQDSLAVHELLDALVMTYAGEAERRSIWLTYDVADALPPIAGNAEALNRALTTLITRAFDASTPYGAVTIGARSDAAGRHIDVFVRDSGAILNEQQIAELFSPKLDGGTLLGSEFMTLDLIVRAHGGVVLVVEEDGANTFILRMPDNRSL